ncbi:MAG TPA: hypothetical protein VK797_18615 [Tepidisphaeraceae bacterium]|nr:hypothetical protein [Tepidisphaeraceae bacterium]
MRLPKRDSLWVARRHGIALLSLLLLGLGGCGGKAQEAAEANPEPVADTAAAKMVGLGKGHVDKFMNYSQTAAMRNMLGGARAVFIAPDVGAVPCSLASTAGPGSF